MVVTNHIEFYRKKVNYHNYKFQINKFINQIVHEFTLNYKGITNYRVREIFWDLVDGNIEFDPSKWYHMFANLIGKLAIYEILFEKNKINKIHKDIHNLWAGYLADLIIPYEPYIQNIFFANLIQNLPVPHLETLLELYQEGVILFNENLKTIVLNNSIHPSKRILKYKTHFLNLFEIFLGKCEYIDQELSKHGGKLHQNRLHEILQLNNSNKRTPPKILRDVLLTLNHIKNAISHSSKAGIIYIYKLHKVRVRDFTSGGKKTYEKIFTFEELYDCYYLLLVILMEFELVALMLTLHRVIRELNFKYNKKLVCKVCGYESLVFVPPERNNVVCKNCKSRFQILINESLE